MYLSLQLPWSPSPSPQESAYRSAGLVKTKGTLFLSPPPVEALKNAFNAPPRPRSTMSAGAVALCKHFERGGASSEKGITHPFWILPKGNNQNKTRIAAEILDQMMEQAVWRNVMLLHPGVAIYEIRNEGGYGMRWTLEIGREDGMVGSGQEEESGEDERACGEDRVGEDWDITKVVFRGFVEPIEGMNPELPGR